MGNSKKKLMKEVFILFYFFLVKKKRLNAKLEFYLTEPHALLHKVSAFIYIDDWLGGSYHCCKNQTKLASSTN